MPTFRRTVLSVFAILAFLLVVRVAASFTFVVGAVTHTLANGFDGRSVQGFLASATRGFPELQAVMAPGRRSAASIIDVQGELEALRDSRSSSRSGSPLVITVGDDGGTASRPGSTGK